MDSRLAQIIAFMWVSFMFSSGLPQLFMVSLINFTLMYWIDKYLILRFYKTPKNYDEKTILFTIDQLKYCFLFHLPIAFFMITNTNILPAYDDAFEDNVKDLDQFI